MSEVRYLKGKGTVSALAIIQIMIATAHFVENSLILHRNYNDFYHDESRFYIF